jgi:ankyrin repeat protein
MEDLQLLNQETLGQKVKTLFSKRGPLCDSEGFYNHQGECWNDSLQMLFLYSDGLRESVQKKLAEAPVDPAEIDELFRPQAAEVLQGLLKEGNLKLEEGQDVQFGLYYVSLIYSYLDNLQFRFQRHYYTESLRLNNHQANAKCSTREKKGQDALTKLKEIALLLRGKGKEGRYAGYFGQEMTLENLQRRRDPKTMGKYYIPGGKSKSRDNVIQIFTHFFQLPLQVSDYTYRYRDTLFRYIENTTGQPFVISPSTACIYGSFQVKEDEKITGHAIGFYTCGGRDFYYDDNNGSIQFPWRTMFAKLLTKKTQSHILAEKVWKTYSPEMDEFMNYEVCMNGECVIKTSDGKELFSSDTYPYLFRIAFELDETKMQTQIITYRPDGKEVVLQRDGREIDPTEYKATIQLADGHSVLFEFILEEPRNQYLDQITTFEFSSAPLQKQTQSLTGTFLGSRLNANQDQLDRILLKQHIQKVLKGEASINDIFYKKQYTPLLVALHLNDYNLVERVIKLGADVNYILNNRTPLFFGLTAVRDIHLKILTLLLKKGAKETLNEPLNMFNGYTPLHGAVIYNEGDEMFTLVEFLLKNGADVNVLSVGHKATTIEYAVFTGAPENVIDLLVKYGAVYPKCPSKENLTERIGVDTPILKAIRERRLIQAGILAKCYRELEIYDALNSENIIGETALKLAIDLYEDPWKDDLLEKLVQSGADVNYVDRYGATPLHYAISQRKEKNVKFLIDNGAKPYVAVPGLGTPLDYAIKLGYPEIVELLTKELAHRRFKGKKTEQAKRKTQKSLSQKSKQNFGFVKRATKRTIRKGKNTIL